MDIRLLQEVPLFKGIKNDELDLLFGCVGARREKYQKGEYVFINGNVTDSIGIVLSGRVLIVKEDVFGNRAVLSNLTPRAVFGEGFVCSGRHTLTISVQASEASEILFLPFERVMNVCPSACGFHNAMIKNMVEMLALKNVELVGKLEVTTKHSLREKLLTYLSQLAQESNETTITSPLGRVELADFFGVDRSALTREMNRMQDDGLIDFNKNVFTLRKI